MKTKLTLLIATLAVGSITSFAYAGPDLDTFGVRKQIADSHAAARVVAADPGPVRYVANPSGKGGTVLRGDAAATNIALFKSSKAKSCDHGSCCAPGAGHKH